MIVSHPAIGKAHIRRDISPCGDSINTLVVETSAPIPYTKTYADADQKFENLINYLTGLAKQESCNFTRLEIRSSRRSAKTHAVKPKSNF